MSYFGATYTLTLVPDAGVRDLVGFRSGMSLSCTANPGDTVGMVMDRFNMYRGPDQQITQLWDELGKSIPFSMVIRGNLRALVRA